METLPLTPTQLAFLEWVSHAPFKTRVPESAISYQDDEGRRDFIELAHWDGVCCFSGHYFAGSNHKLVSKEDHDVCPRERAWRKYVRLRDGLPDLPTKH
jgi:hypothetical protein